jgi:DNA polymerase-2
VTTITIQGWLLDLYADGSDTQIEDILAGAEQPGTGGLGCSAGPEEGGCATPRRLSADVILWLVDDAGKVHRLRHPFAVTFYASGPALRLRALCHFLRTEARRLDVPLCLKRVERRDLFSEKPLTLLAVEVGYPAVLAPLFWRASTAFPDLTYFDADINLALRYAAAYNIFPMARCEAVVEGDGLLRALRALDSPWDLDPAPPALRVLSMEPDTDPGQDEPRLLGIRCGRCSYRLAFDPPRPFLINLRAILNRHDPDLLLTAWGDTWLLPRLLQLSQEWDLPLPLNRDEECAIAYRPERTYFSYGQIIYRGQQMHLFGRLHIDILNAVFYQDYGMEGILELARVTALPVQTAARVSPGTGISAMQILTALRQGILVPWRKQQAERPKTAFELMQADQGGLVYQPVTGLHRDVAEIDFISMYPSIMAHFNISPETVGAERPTAELAPELGMVVDRSRLGLVPQTLKPLLEKRIAFKQRLNELSRWDSRHKIYKARATAHKWLLVTCFGYLGYRNARFGRIEAHEAVTAYGREALLRAKEAAEDLGFTVLHLYVDGLWVKKSGASQVSDFQPLLEEISGRTGLPIALDGIYRWVAFLTSRLDERVPVANRYFGVFQDGSLKMRGIEARRNDSARFVSDTQLEILELLKRTPEAGRLPEILASRRLSEWRSGCLRPVVALLRRKLRDLRHRRIPLDALMVSQKLSRELEEYRTPSPAARAANQLCLAGKTQPRAGQRVHFIYTRGDPGVYAWRLSQRPDPATVDVTRYTELLLRAAAAVLEPFGVREAELRSWVLRNASEPHLEGFNLLPAQDRFARRFQLDGLWISEVVRPLYADHPLLTG